MGAKSKTAVKGLGYGDDRLVEVLVEILDHCGVWRDDDGDYLPSWKRLAASLEGLAHRLEDFAKHRGEVTEILPEQHLLLTIEEDIQNIKGCLTEVFRDTDDISGALELCHGLGGFSRRNPLYQISSLSASLPDAVRNQRMNIFHALQSADVNLRTIYVCIHSKQSDALRSLANSLRNLSMDLRQKCIKANKGVWKDAQDLVKGLLAATEKVSFTHEHNISIQNTDDARDAGRLYFDSHPMASIPTGSLQSTNVFNAADSFAKEGPGSELERCILLVGLEGSGKTHCLDQIQRLASSSLRGKCAKDPGAIVCVWWISDCISEVIKPSLPFDVLGKKVGSAEDLLLSLLSYAMNAEKRSILLLDDVECIIGLDDIAPTATPGGNTTTAGGPSEPHLVARNRVLLLSLLELVRRDTSRRTMLICTSRNAKGKAFDRFDRVFVLENPTIAARRKVLEEYISWFFCDFDTTHTDKINEALSNVVDCTTGLSYANLAFQCRNALLAAAAKNSGPLGFLGEVKSQLEQSVPDSLKMGFLSDFVEMRVSTFRDLRERFCTDLAAEFNPSTLPLYGNSMDCAWEALQHLIVTPLCEASALYKLMFYDGSTGGNKFVGGVLLTGAPGSGKTSLAYHCAALAASRNPSVKLLDVSCTSLIHKQVGSSEQAIHRLFVTAKAAAPCILLLDGIENIAAVRGNDNTTEGTMDRVLSTLLTEVDGVDSENLSIENPACLAIIGITHNPEWVDPALRRPGRLERTIKLGLLETEARRKIAERELSGARVMGFGEGNTHVDLKTISSYVAERTAGFTGASVVGVCNDAKLCASKDIMKVDGAATDNTEKCSITLLHVEEAVDSQRAGKNPWG
jgi:transitional endoplasmic reticulum ATPase